MTLDDETVERVARAINAARYGGFNDTRDPPAFEDEDKSGQVYAYRLARAAISAMPPRELLREALEALEPFALHAAEQLDHYIPPAIAACDATPIWGGSFNDRTEVTVGDLRRARAAAGKIRAALGGE